MSMSLREKREEWADTQRSSADKPQHGGFVVSHYARDPKKNMNQSGSLAESDSG